MSNPIQQYSKNRNTNLPLNNQNLSNQYPPNYNPSIPVRLNPSKLTNSQGKQIAYIANPREQPSRISNKNGSSPDEQEIRKSRLKEYVGSPRSDLPTMTNQDAKYVEKQDLKFEELKKKSVRESRVGAVDQPGHMFCGSIGWIVGCIIGLLILTALLLFGLGVIGGPINASDTSDSSKVSLQSPIIASKANLSQSPQQKPVSSSGVNNHSPVNPVDSSAKGKTSATPIHPSQKPVASSGVSNHSPVGQVDSSAKGKTSVSPNPQTQTINKTPVSSTSSATVPSKTATNKL